jgi:thiol:disulfide interchange protein DsbA
VRRRLGASASPADPKNGVEYAPCARRRPPNLARRSKSRSSSRTPARTATCFDPQLAAWVKKQGDNIVFKRMHISREGSAAAAENVLHPASPWAC